MREPLDDSAQETEWQDFLHFCEGEEIDPHGPVAAELLESGDWIPEPDYEGVDYAPEH